MKNLFLLLILILVLTFEAAGTEFKLGNIYGEYEAVCTHLTKDVDDSTVNYNALTVAYAKADPSGVPRALLMKFPDSLNGVIVGMTIDSAFLDVVLGGIEQQQGGDSTFVLARLLEFWHIDTASIMYRRDGVAWSLSGARGAGTDYSITDSLHFRFGYVWNGTSFADGANEWSMGDTITFPITDFVSAWAADTSTNYGIKFSGVSGYERFAAYTGLNVTEALRPTIRVYYTEGGTTTPPTSATIDSLHNDYSTELDSIPITTVVGSDVGYENTIIAWSTSGYPDSSNSGDTLNHPYSASTTWYDTLTAHNGTETYTLYVSAWNYDDVNGWSTRATDSYTFTVTASDVSDPDPIAPLLAFTADIDNDIDTIGLYIGTVDSVDYSRIIVRYSTSVIPTDTTGGTQFYAASSAVENTTIYVGLDLTQPTWLYCAGFALDEVGNASSSTVCSTYVGSIPAGGSSVWSTVQRDSIIAAVQVIYNLAKDTLYPKIETVLIYTDTSLYATVPMIWTDSLAVDTSETGLWIERNITNKVLARMDTLQILLAIYPGAKTFSDTSATGDTLWLCFDADTTDGVWDTLMFRTYYHENGVVGGTPDTVKVR